MNRKGGVALWVLVLLVVVVVVVFFYSSSLSNKTIDARVVDAAVSSGFASEGNVIKITDKGFDSKEITINKGESVTWFNEWDRESWPASAMHPTHTVYPGSDIKKCGSSEDKNIFDACKGLKPGESYTFIFNSAGSWGYHDHINSGMYGKVIVK